MMGDPYDRATMLKQLVDLRLIEANQRQQTRIKNGVTAIDSLRIYVMDVADLRDWYEGELAKIKGLDNA